MKKSMMISLAAAATLFTVGCSVDDVKDLLDTNAIYVVNGTGGNIIVSVTDKDDYNLSSHKLAAKAYYTIDQSKTTVSYDGGHSHSFNHGGPYLYAATNCDADGYLTDTTSSSRVHVVNLTDNTYTDNIKVWDDNNVSYTLSDDINACSIIDAHQADTIKIQGTMHVQFGSGDIKEIAIPEKVAELANSIKFDVVIYSTTEGTIVPLATYDDVL